MEFVTLTPIWAGGFSSKADRLCETGLLGSMRWWYEVLVRGVGGKACDPNGDGANKQNKCNFQVENYLKAKDKEKRLRLHEAGLCDVCQLFGAAGWKRRFRLTVADNTEKDKRSPQRIVIDKDKCKANPKNNRQSSWQFPDNPRSGRMELKLQGLYSDFSPEILEGLLQFIADWGSLGAKGQMGFGVVRPAGQPADTGPLYRHLKSLAGNFSSSNSAYDRLPSLQNMFFARIKVKNNSDKETFEIKCNLRRLFDKDTDLQNFVMGTVKRGRMAAKIKMSRPYEGNIIRLWGWIPSKININGKTWDREDIMKKIHGHMLNNYKLLVWRELGSLRDTVLRSSDPVEFLKSLLAVKEGENDL